MSLNYDYGNVENHDEVMFDENDEMRPVSQCIIFRTMFVGIQRITEENYKVFHKRCMLLTAANEAPPLYKWTEDDKIEYYDITEEDCKAHIGLTTNAAVYNKTEFIKRVIKPNVQ